MLKYSRAPPPSFPPAATQLQTSRAAGRAFSKSDTPLEKVAAVARAHSNNTLPGTLLELALQPSSRQRARVGQDPKCWQPGGTRRAWRKYASSTATSNVMPLASPHAELGAFFVSAKK